MTSPGPWTIHGGPRDMYIVDPDNCTVCHILFADKQAMANAKLICAALALAEAVKPLAEKWLYPDDVGHLFTAEEVKEETCDDQVDEVYIQRGAIRAARKALKDAGL